VCIVGTISATAGPVTERRVVAPSHVNPYGPPQQFQASKVEGGGVITTNGEGATLGDWQR